MVEGLAFKCRPAIFRGRALFKTDMLGKGIGFKERQGFSSQLQHIGLIAL